MSVIQSTFQNDSLIASGEDDLAGVAAVCAERTDSQLVESVLAGDTNAFEHIFDRHKRHVAGVASRYFHRPDQIEEALQTAFAKAFADLASFRGDNARSFGSWLARITSNSCLDILRLRKRRPEDLADDLGGFESLGASTEMGSSTEDDVIGRDLAAKLLARVPADDRALLHMLYAEEMTIAEIAGVFGWSISKTKVRAWRARNYLRRVMKQLM